MIARIWRGTVSVDMADAYHRYLQETGVADYRATPGNAGVSILKRVDGDVVHFLLLTFWESVGSIRAFAGDEIEKARYFPDDPAFLIEMPSEVEHFEVLTASDTALKGEIPVDRT